LENFERGGAVEQRACDLVQRLVAFFQLFEGQFVYANGWVAIGDVQASFDCCALGRMLKTLL
jgi:hypothetical protein